VNNFIAQVAAQVLENVATDTITNFVKAVFDIGIDGLVDALTSGSDSETGIEKFVEALDKQGIDTSQFSSDDWETLATVISEMIVQNS
jgi:hypothetical protein